jgi:hypothetical protein
LIYPFKENKFKKRLFLLTLRFISLAKKNQRKTLKNSKVFQKIYFQKFLVPQCLTTPLIQNLKKITSKQEK